MRPNLTLLATVLSLQILAPQSNAQGLDINSMGIPNIAYRAIGFFSKWQETNNLEKVKKSEENSEEFEASKSWMLLDRTYAISDDKERVYQYVYAEESKTWYWEKYEKSLSSFQPTLLPDVYMYSEKKDDRLYFYADGDSIDTELCSEFYSLQKTGQAVYGIFEACDLDEGQFLGKLDLAAEEVVEIASIPDVDFEDMVAISADSNGNCYVVSSSGVAYHYDSSSDSWTQIAQPETQDDQLYIVDIAANTFDGSVWLLVDQDLGQSEGDVKHHIYLYDTVEDIGIKYSSHKNVQSIDATYLVAASITDDTGAVYNFDIVIFLVFSIGQKINELVYEKLSALFS